MEKKYTFLTGSSYEGSWESSLCALNGFGTYLYPDLSVYRGYFQNGKFHGYGRLRLAAPHKFTVEGNFVNGVLKDIAYMWFHDGLTVKTRIDENNKLNFSDWKYCSDVDRRYVRELIDGLEPVTPQALITAEDKDRELERDTFDTEEGIYKQTTAYLTECLPPFRYARYIECQDEKDWIVENCRRADVDLEEPSPEVERKILDTCLSVEKDLQRRVEQKAVKTDPCRQYFYKLCQREREAGAECVISDAEVNCPQASETSPRSSFSATSIKEDIIKVCHDLQINEVFGVHEEKDANAVRHKTIFENPRQVVRFNSAKTRSKSYT